MPAEEVPASGTLVRRAFGLAFVLVVAALVVSALPGLADVRARFLRADPVWLAVTFACALGSTLSYVAAVRGTLSRRLGWRASWNVGMAEQGSNVLVPTGGVAGPALGALLLRRLGVPDSVAASRSAALFLLTSATSFAAIALTGAATGVGLLPGRIPWFGTLLPAALAVVVMAAVAALARLPAAHASEGQGRVARTARQVAALMRDGVREALVLVRERDPLVLVGCVGYLAFDVGSLAAGFHAFGDPTLPIGAFVLAYTLGQVGGLIPTPGGLGGSEGGLVGVLVLYGAAAVPAAAAVLAYRVFELGLPVIFGLVAFARIRHTTRGDKPTAVAVRPARRPAYVRSSAPACRARAR